MSNTTVNASVITKEVIDRAMDYETYRTKMDDLVKEGKTTGTNQNEDLAHYTKLNHQRMKRLDKKVLLTDEIKEALRQIKSPQIWLVLTEAWCGDAAQNIPVIAKMAEASDQISLKFILRDEHLEIMDEYLTNGGRSIPKLIALDAESMEELGTWGPRPEPVQEMMIAFKKQEHQDFSAFKEKLQKWYNADETRTMQQEFLEKLPHWS